MSLGQVYSSDITAMRKARALYAFKTVKADAVLAGNGALSEQPNTQLNSEYLARTLGGMNTVFPNPVSSSATGSPVNPGCGCGAYATS